MRVKKNIPALLCAVLPVFFFSPYPAQDVKKIDSLLNLLHSAKEDTGRVSILLALSFRYQGFDTEKAFKYGKEALKTAEQLQYRNGTGTAHNNLGDLYWYNSDYASSSDHYFKALSIYEGSGDKAAIANCYRNIGWVYYKQGNNKEALRYYNLSLKMNKELGLKRRMAENYNDIGIVYARMQRYTDALATYELSLQLQDQIGSKMGMAANYGNIGEIYSSMGENELALENLLKAKKYSEEVGNRNYLAIDYCNLGELYMKMGKYSEAEQSLDHALYYAKQVNYKESLLACYTELSALHQHKGDYKKSLDFMQMAYDIRDSIYNEKNSRQINEMSARYESEKKELMISSLEKDKALSGEKLEREKNFKVYLILFCVLIAAFAFVLLRGNVQKKKANIALSSAYREIEVKNRDITDSINYSKRIQDAILPAREIKYRLFPDAFVFFRPKDIVSGDFYWFAEKSGKKLIAACDCTGHGVPGSLMSMIGNNFLNHIVVEKGITVPAEILHALDHEVRKSLKQDAKSETKDGMDIAICSFDLVSSGEKEIWLEYAGAQRPLWIIRAEAGEAEEIRPDKFSIGGTYDEAAKQFTNHKIGLYKGDAVYIFSDGYADQFGGPDGKKFMSRRFRDLLLSVQDKTMQVQERIINETLDKWKGPSAQVDDILVIGIRV